MLNLSINDGGSLTATQRDRSPTVYLDHWAIRGLSEDQALANRFTTALRSHGGTLALSWANLIEFRGVTNEQQTRSAEEFIESNLPRVFFIEVDPFVVIRREDELLTGDTPTAPHADPELLNAFVRLKPDSVRLFTAHGLFQGLQNQLGRQVEEMADVFMSRIATLRNELKSDPAFQATLRRVPNEPQIQRGTRIILRELARAIIVDQQTKIEQNDAMDFFHAVVPIAYCDLVLLDKYWEAQVARVRQRLSRLDLLVPMAIVLSKKDEGLKRLMLALEQ